MFLASCKKEDTEEKDFLFKKTQECVTYKVGVEEKLGELGGINSLDFFYSPSLNTCVHSFQATNSGTVNILIVNTLSEETIMLCENNIRPLDICLQKIKELK